MNLHQLDNIIWHSLTSNQAAMSTGNQHIRRYQMGLSQLIGAANAQSPDLWALNEHCERDEHFYILGWNGVAPHGWQIDLDAHADQLFWPHVAPERMVDADIIRLDQHHVSRMMQLAELTHPGPFAERTIEFGEFYGILDGDRLLAMAGERMHAAPLREISGVCTHPSAQSRGLAKRLMNHVLRLQISRGQTPFLHVMADNTHARALYERMGFVFHQRLSCRVVSRI
jgi:ribosomal protein S18 acetylase RimI-like enzyme